MNKMNEKNKIVVITGAAGGIGSVFAKELASEGYAVAVLDYNLESAKKIANEIVENNWKAIAIQGNVIDRNSMENAREQVKEQLGLCNVLINCAGIQDPLAKTTNKAYIFGEELRDLRNNTNDRSFFDLEGESLSNVMNVNWLGTIISSQTFAVDMVGREGNSVINITSMAAYDALSMVPGYASSKAAVDMFTKWLSNYLANQEGKVRVNAVAPGYFVTPLNKDMYVKPDGSYTERYYNVINRTPMGRLGEIKELVGAIKFFADPEMSGYITGQVIAVDGGFLSCPGI